MLVARVREPEVPDQSLGRAVHRDEVRLDVVGGALPGLLVGRIGVKIPEVTASNNPLPPMVTKNVAIKADVGIFSAFA